MRSIYFAIMFLLVGFILGWMGRSYDIDRAFRETTIVDNQKEVKQMDNTNAEELTYGKNYRSASDDDIEKNPFINREDEKQIPAEIDASDRHSSSVQPGIDVEQQFKQLLQQKSFEPAVDLYRELDLSGDARVAEFRAQIIAKLKSYLDVEDGDAFTELANSFLSVYYNDIDVLLLLAEFNQRMNYFIEGLNVYQMASEYAYTSINTQKVREGFNQFISKVDGFYSSQQSWYMLRQIYERAELVNMLNPEQRIRLAQIYSVTGDVYSGQTILQELIDSGQSVSKAREALQSIDGGAPQNTPLSYQSAVALIQYGNQFAAELALPDQYNEVKLLLDTGASLTTLSTTAFNQLSDHSQYTRLGSRMFHTANGVAMGAVYKFKRVHFGSFVLHDVDIAVLDFSMTGEVQGLLGMNILGQFKFHINQKESQLELSALQ